MLLPATLSRRPVAIFCFFCIIIFSTCIFLTSLKYPLQTINPLSHFQTDGKPTTSPEAATEEPLDSSLSNTDLVDNQTVDSLRDEFIAISSQVEIPPFDPSGIQKICSEAPWSKDLVFQCTDAIGGLNNVRQQILTCVRWAIEFKASIVFPSVKPRKQTNASETIVHAYSAARELDVLFNRERFIKRLQEGCPQLVVYDNVSSVAKPEQIKKVPNVWIKTGSTKKEMNAIRTNWTLENPGEKGKIRMAHVSRQATEYEVCNDGIDFANSFGQLLTLREDTHRLAAAVLYELSSRYSLNLNPKENFSPNGFLGIHLRTAADAVKSKWMSYEEQAAMYQQLTLQYALPVIYVASGNRSSVEIFAKTVYPTPVVTKTSLLSGPDLELLESLSWDQQAQVDYLVLIRATRYLGMSNSNFSWAVAVARRAAGKNGTCGLLEEEERKLKVERGIALRDELSIIIGKPSGYHFGTRSWP